MNALVQYQISNAKMEGIQTQPIVPFVIAPGGLVERCVINVKLEMKIVDRLLQ